MNQLCAECFEKTFSVYVSNFYYIQFLITFEKEKKNKGSYYLGMFPENGEFWRVVYFTMICFAVWPIMNLTNMFAFAFALMVILVHHPVITK